MSDSIVIDNRPFRPRLPDYLKQSVPHGAAFRGVRDSIRDLAITTVCEEAKCPNSCYRLDTVLHSQFREDIAHMAFDHIDRNHQFLLIATNKL